MDGPRSDVRATGRVFAIFGHQIKTIGANIRRNPRHAKLPCEKPRDNDRFLGCTLVAHTIITGGSSGIGAAAEASAVCRSDVALIARNEAPLIKLRNELAARFPARRFHFEMADAGDDAAI